MKLITIISTLFLLTYSVYGQDPSMADNRSVSSQAFNHRLESITLNKWENGKWETHSKKAFIYDQEGNLTEAAHLNYISVDDVWSEDGKITYEYANDGTKSYTSYLWFNGSVWKNLSKSDFSYDEDGLLTQDIAYNRNLMSDEWKPLEKNVYTYDDHGNYILTMHYRWDATDNEWVEHFKSTYLYNNSNDNISYINYEYNGSTDTWDKIFATEDEYIYNINGQIITDKYSTSFYQIEQREYNYDNNGNIIQKTISDVVNFDPIYEYQLDYTYDTDCDISEMILPDAVWFNNYYEWMSNSIKLSDINNKPMDIIRKKYDDFGKGWVNEHKYTFSYTMQQITGVDNTPTDLIAIYPNPFSDHISFCLKEGKGFLLELFDTQGQKIISKEIYNRQNIELNPLKSGVYFYNLLSDNKIITGKLIKR